MYQDLQFCGLTSDLVTEFKDSANRARDRVELCSDRTYILLEERREKYGAKRQSDGRLQGGNKKAKMPDESEIIVLL
jgi:hypothetical protein